MRKKLPKILVTGGAGFIGSAFVRLLLKDCDRRESRAKRGIPPARHQFEPKAVVVDKLTYAADLARLEEVDGKYKFYHLDICNKKRLEVVFKREKPEIIVHFAAETHVDRSILNASAFLKTNVIGTQVLLDNSKRYGINKFIHISCYDEKTRALTMEGLKNYKELKTGDKVFSLNPKTLNIELKPIEKVIIQKYKGRMVHFKNKRIDLLVTPNHNMYILNTSKKNKRLIIEKAEKVLQRSILYMPAGKWRGRDDEYVDIKGHGRVRTKDLMYILGIFIGDGFISYQEKQKETRTGLTRPEYLKSSRDAQSGRFKSIEKVGNHITTCHSYRIFFDIPENDKCRVKVERTLSDLGIKYHYHKGKAGTHLYFTSKIFMGIFAQCGRSAYDKHIPRWALSYSASYLKYLLEGLMDSDGHGGKVYHTVSDKLVANFCELCIKLNLKPNIGKRHTKSFIRGRKLESDSYVVSIGKTIKSISRNRNKIVDYKGDIWCLKVKDNKNFLVERNGRLDFCGNTDEVYGEISKGKFNEDSPLKPNSPYAASKAAADLLIKSYIRTYGFPAIIIRPCNNYGPWQYPEKLIPLSILKILRNERIPVYGVGKNVREWLYVDDCATGILEIMRKGKIGEIYNLGSQEEKQNIEVVKMILNILRRNENMFQFIKDRPGHDFRYRLDSQKLSQQTGWKPKVRFDEGIRLTLGWCLKRKNWLFSKWGDIARLYNQE